ncbi:MAG: F0F1 ATP synthase subunit delta [Minisyncoccia bacterium]
MVPTARHITEALTVVSDAHGEKKAVSALTSFLTRSHLTHLLPAIVLLLKKKAVEEGKQDTISITSATTLSEKVIDRISDLAHKNVGTIPASVNMVVDKSLVGGFVAVYKGKVFDGSVKTMLSSLITKK